MEKNTEKSNMDFGDDFYSDDSAIQSNRSPTISVNSVSNIELIHSPINIS